MLLSDLLKKKIGVWGFGVVGQSATRFFTHYGAQVVVLEKKPVSAHEDYPGVTFFSEDTCTPQKFFDSIDYALVSPGICISNFSEYYNKLLTEFDLFRQAWSGKIIAITGTVGKTSVTHLLGAVLQTHKIPVCIGGNIGTGMLDLCLDQTSTKQDSLALIELSSFQLEHVQKAAPDIAVITNIYPNHLDRHGNFSEYCAAKARISVLQNSTQVTIMPEELKVFPEFSQKSGIKKYFSLEAIKDIPIPPISYPINWAIIYSVLEELRLPARDIISQIPPAIALPHHRLEPIITHNTITWYNDSKSTVPEATYMALSMLTKTPVVLIAGGISKGVDRSNFLAQLPAHVQTVILFGSEASQLAQNPAPNCPIIIVPDLKEAVLTAHRLCPRPGAVLFSPGGASFDLFANYIERGEKFATCVRQLL